MKRCTKCGLEKPLIEFSRDSTRGDGRFPWCPSCITERNRAYRKANPEGVRARDKAYRKANSEKLRAYSKIWRKANPGYQKNWRNGNRDGVRTYSKAWRETNPEGVRIYQKNWRKANPEKERIYEKGWRERNPDQHKKIRRGVNQRRRARKYGATVIVRFTLAMEVAKYQEQGGRCYYAGEDLNGIYHIEHKLPLCRGGNDSPDNIVLACRSCNVKKGKMTDIEFFDKLKTKAAA